MSGRLLSRRSLLAGTVTVAAAGGLAGLADLAHAATVDRTTASARLVAGSWSGPAPAGVSGPVTISIRPERIGFGDAGLAAKTVTRIFQGNHWLFQCESECGSVIVIRQNDGQPQPEWNFVSDLNSSAPHARHLYTPVVSVSSNVKPMPRTKLRKHPTEKLRLANELRSTRGFLDRHVRVTNSAAEMRKSATRATVIGEVQPCFGASLIAISSATNAAAPSAKERKSKRRN